MTDFYIFKADGIPITKGDFDEFKKDLMIEEVDEDNQTITYIKTKNFGYFLEDLSDDLGKDKFFGYLIENYNYEPDTDVQQLEQELFKEMHVIASAGNLTILDLALGKKYTAEQFKNTFIINS